MLGAILLSIFSTVFQTFPSYQNTDAGISKNSVVNAVQKRYPGVLTPADRYQSFKLALNNSEGIDGDQLFKAIGHIKFKKEARTISRDLQFRRLYLELFDEASNKNKGLISAFIEKGIFLRENEKIYSETCFPGLCNYCSELNLGQALLNPELSKLIDEDLHLKLSRHGYPKTRLQEFSKALDDNDIKKAFLIAEYFYYNAEVRDIKNILGKKIGTLNPLNSNYESDLKVLNVLSYLLDANTLLSFLDDYTAISGEDWLLNRCCCFCFCSRVIYDGECGEVCCYKPCD